MDIYLEDTGYVNPTFGLTETPFVDYESATDEQKKLGEFKVSVPVRLKVTTINLGDKSNIQISQNPLTSSKSVTHISNEIMKITLTCMLKKPINNFTDTSNLGDLPDLKNILLMKRSQGHKDLYIKDDVNPDVEKLFSLYYLIDIFGRTDNGNSLNKKHLNVFIDSFSQNEGINKLSYNLVLSIVGEI